MKRLVAAVLLGVGCAAAPPPPPFTIPAGSASRAPYDLPPVGSDTVRITIDMRAAREILALLVRPSFSPADAKQLESVPAVEYAIRESNRPPEIFERDLAAAFDEQTRIAVFDFRKIREDNALWEDLLATISTREVELGKLASDRARALLPADRVVSVTLPFYLTFGLPGRADHIMVRGAGGEEWGVVVDLARALSDVEASAPSEKIKHLSRLMASEAYLRAWAEYRAASPAWNRHDTTLGQLEPLLLAVADAGPVAIYSVDENFFPLSVWLREPMKSSIDDLNRVADRLMSAEADLDARMEVAAEIKKPDFGAQVAGPAGAFLADGIIQASGIEAYRAALAGGPRTFFEAYDRAASVKGSGLVPLAKSIKERLAAPVAPAHAAP